MGKKQSAIFESVDIKGAARLSGLPLTMVNYLDRTNVLVPSGPKNRKRGRPREYSFGDVVILRVLASLLASGISVARLKRGLIELRKHHPEIKPESLSPTYVVSDGTHVYFRTKNNVLETLDTKGQMAFFFIVELKVVKQQVIEIYRNDFASVA